MGKENKEFWRGLSLSNFSSGIAYSVVSEVIPNPFGMSVIMRESLYALLLYADSKVITLKINFAVTSVIHCYPPN